MKANISILGIGNGGRNVVKQLAKQNPEIKSFLYTKGDSEENISKALEDGNVLILVAGLGGHTGSTMIIDVVKKATKKGIRTVAVVTTPFAFEGQIRMDKATQACSELRKLVDELHICDNDILKTKYTELNLLNAFNKSDEEVINNIQFILTYYGSPEETETRIIKCPHCGHKRRVLFFKDFWSKEGLTFWSDDHMEANDWFEPTFTQQCPKCGKFFTRKPQGRLTIVNKPCAEKAILSYPQLKAAVKELRGVSYSEQWASAEFWIAFNAFYKDTDEIPEGEQEFNRSNMQWLLDFYQSNSPLRLSSTEFELNRLLGNRDACERILEITLEEYIQQQKEFRKLRGRPWYDDKEMWTRRYNKIMDELNASLDLPLKPYKRRD